LQNITILLKKGELCQALFSSLKKACSYDGLYIPPVGRMLVSFLLIAGREAAEEPLTIGIQRTLGTRGNFGLVARYQRVDAVLAFVLPVKGVPKDR
jgi:hypothetical protein